MKDRNKSFFQNPVNFSYIKNTTKIMEGNAFNFYNHNYFFLVGQHFKHNSKLNSQKLNSLNVVSFTDILHKKHEILIYIRK